MNVDPSNPSLVQVPGKPHTSAYRLKKIRRLSAANDGGDNAPVTSGGMTGGEPEWRCTECGKLLGVANGNQLHIRVQKHREYLVGFPVTANCHGCGTLNNKSSC